MNPVHNTHCTQFMLDYMPCTGKEEKNTFQDYMKREEDYDLAFSRTCIDLFQTPPIHTPKALLNLFLKIQTIAMSHIQARGVTSQGQPYQSGIYVGNSYAVNKRLVSDFEGIKELITQIWLENKQVMLTFFSEKKKNGYKDKFFINNDGLSQHFLEVKERNEHRLLIQNDDSEKTLKLVIDFVEKFYNVETLSDGVFPFVIQPFYIDPKLKKKQAIELIRDYLKNIPNPDNRPKEEKIFNICYLCRELEQLHLFQDGNGRSVYILANLLAQWNGLDPFYPRNICVFDANSLITMAREFFEGQDRFKAMFGSQEQLTNQLARYSITVENLIDLAKEKYSKFNAIMNSIRERNFNLSLRQSSADKNALGLLEFLLQNLSILNIDIHSKGEKSGTAMDVALKNRNIKAIKLIEKYIPV